MNTNLTATILALNGTLPTLSPKFCKKCGTQLISVDKDFKVDNCGEYSENTGEPYLKITRTQSCPKGHIKKKWWLVDDFHSYTEFTYSQLKSATHLDWREQ
jgi:hypothetical protein